jgi:hypothetical protein
VFDYAQQISDQAPLVNGRSTNATCTITARLIEELRDEWDEESGTQRDTAGHDWYTVLFPDGVVSGRWSYDELDAALNCMLYRDAPALLVQLDRDGDLARTWRAAHADDLLGGAAFWALESSNSRCQGEPDAESHGIRGRV